MHKSESSTTIKLASGRLVSKSPDVKKIEINTYCPEKWVSLDLETGELWVGSKKGWKKATKALHKEVINTFLLKK